MKKVIGLFVFLFMLGIQFSIAQERQITGKVISMEDGSALPGVTVMVKGTTIGVATDIDGRYSLKVGNNATLVFSFVGMKSQEVQVGNKNVVDVKLVPESETMDEVLVVAYGTTKKSSFTGSAVSVGQKQMESRPLANAIKVLEGASAGVQFNAGSGQPGASPSIRIRGFGSINASNEPLYVVDGVPFEGALASINPDDIENISILKDASSSALYGSRAANGVVMITTKKGRNDHLTFNVKVNQGITTRGIPEYKTVGTNGYYPLMWESYRNSLISGSGYSYEEASQIASGLVTGKKGIADLLVNNPYNVPANEIVGVDGKLNPNAQLLYPGDLDWEDAIKRTGYRADYTISASGGNDKTDYYFSLGYMNEDGYAIKTKMERMTARANVNIQPRKWLKAGANLATSLANSTEIGSTGSASYKNPFYFSRNIGPIYPIYKHDATGAFVLDNLGEKIYEWDNRGAGASPGRHIVAEREWDSNSYKRNEVNVRTYIDLYLYKGLKFTANVGYDLRNNLNGTYDNPHVGDGAPAGRANRTNYRYDMWNYNQLLSYENSINNHSFDVLIGHESFNKCYKYFYGMRQSLVAEGNDELVNFTTTNSLTSYTRDYRTEGYLARVNYNYDNKYYLSGSFRRDGSSKFYKDARWGNFWSVGASWRMDQEEFIKNLKWIDQLKIRASYGQVGNDGVLDSDGYDVWYAWQNLYDINNNANEPGFVQSVVAGNRSLEWESNNNFDVAIEYGFLNRIRGTVEYFHRKSDNLLFNVPLPLSSGVISQWQNIGSMYNEGVEFQINADAIVKNGFKWNIDFNLTHIKNEITELPQKEIVSGTKKLMKGHSIYDYWLREYMGVNPTNGDALYKKDILDVNGNVVGTTTTSDPSAASYYYCGSAIPKVYGAMTNNFSYKGLELSFLFTYQLGGKTYDGTYANLMSSKYGSALHQDIEKRWQKPGDITDVPRLDDGNTSYLVAGSTSRWLTDASYLALKNAVISYNLPHNWVSKIDLSAIRVYVSGENLFMWTKRKGMNPQYSFAGTTSNVYSPARLFTLGINIAF